jgi:hypothetical protein
VRAGRARRQRSPAAVQNVTPTRAVEITVTLRSPEVRNVAPVGTSADAVTFRTLAAPLDERNLAAPLDERNPPAHPRPALQGPARLSL